MACAAAAGLLAPVVPAQFATAFDIPAASEPDAVVAGDWDNDQDLDLAVAVDNPDGVLFLFNDGEQSFGLPVAVSTGASTSPHGLAAGDFDDDGDLDVAVSLADANAVRVLLNSGTGSFALGSLTPTGAEPRTLRAADLNAGTPDLVSVNREGNSITVMLSNGNGAFSATTLGTGGDPRDVAAGDLNGDGDVDLAVTAHGNRRVELFANGGTGTFSGAGTMLVGNQMQPTGITVLHADADDDLDLAVTASGSGLDIAVLFSGTGPGNGAGSYASPVSFPIAGANPSRIEAGDFNVDGLTDLATANEDSADVTVLLGNGLGGFGAPGLFAVGAGPQWLLAADLDGNGGVDLLTANETAGSVSVLLNLNGASVFEPIAGTGLAGAAGIPALAGDGTLQGGTAVSLDLMGAAPLATAGLVIGLSQLNQPFKGGTLVPDTDIVLLLPTSTSGGISLSGVFPGGVPADTSLFLQVIVADAGAPEGFALSNALEATTP